jgi:DNA-binding FrmR family transcriptional regulator
MTILKQIKAIERRLDEIEKSLLSIKVDEDIDSSSASYKEVIDEWLNGRPR